MAKIIDQAILDDREYLRSLKNIDANIQKMSSNASKGFGSIDNTAKTSGAQIGAVAGVVASLTTEFINLGKAALSNLINIGKQATSTALEFDTVRTRLLGIFDGSEAAADTAFNFIRDRSKALGIDLGELAGAFLPKTESLDQFERVAKIATALAASDPEQGAIGARIALIEALSGTFTSLQRRFEIPKEDIDRLKEAFDTEGMEGFLTELEKVLKESGKDFDTLANTAQSSINRVGQSIQEKLGQSGAPVVEALQRQFDDLGAVLEDRDADFTEIANRIGEVAASVVDFIGTNLADFLANLDKEQVLEIVDGFQSIFDTAFDLVETLGLLEWPQGFLDGLETSVQKLDQALTTALQLSALVKAEAARAEAEANVRRQAAGAEGETFGRGRLFAGILGGIGAPNAADIENQAAAAGEKAFQDVMLETKAILEETDKAEAERATAREERAKRAATSSEDLANTLLKQRQDAADAARALDEYETALEKVNEQQIKLETELEQEASDLLLSAERKRLDALQDFANKRVDQARKSRQKLEDIELGLDRDLEDADRAQARKEIEIDKEQADKRIDVELDYQRELADIRNRFAFDLEEAAQRRDAVTFLRLQRQQQEEIQQAQTGRDQDLEDTRTEAERKREELRISQGYEEEDARLSYQRKLEDRRIADEREREEITIAEQRKNEEINLWQQQQLDDLNTSYQRKQEALRASLEAELAIIAEYEAAKTAIVLEEAERRAEIARQANEARRSQDRSRQDRINQQIAEGRTVIAGRASGGPVSAGGSYLVGEAGPELFVPDTAGAIVPSTMLMGTIPSSNVVNNVTTNNSASLGGLVDASSLDAILAAKVQNLLVSILGRM